ncbi:dihydrofolate reductase [Variovorax sp. M-6]|uniref:dihydrofolate reductase n=1 Tax=Variovorax sp. M-6 TaxID=3233041 RepID=UPI003F97ADA6
MRINLILARAANGVIGLDGTMPWHLPEDMAHFKRVTAGAPVVMGRKTWDSIPPRFRPLAGRRNIVVTRNAEWRAEGAERAGSLEEAIALCERGQATEAWVVGGAQIYAEAEPLAQRVVLTEIDRDYDGDAWAPEFGAGWQQTARESHVAANGLPFSFVTLERR